MLGFSLVDALALFGFLTAWGGYNVLIERSAAGKHGLDSLMNNYRQAWMAAIAVREARVIDTQILAALQNGTAFFASTSLIALGGSVTLLRAPDDFIRTLNNLPFGFITTPTLWEVKALGLILIFGYAFFKFAWAYRLFNFTAIILGAAPAAGAAEPPERRRTALRAAAMNIVASRHFNRGQRAFLISLGYAGWFVTPYAMLLFTALILYVMWARQFASDARQALRLDVGEPGGSAPARVDTPP